MSTVIKGRGALSRPPGRFERTVGEAVDDGWHADAISGDDDDALPRLVTTLSPERAKSIITRNDSPDIPFDQSINPYRGCEHGCIYCYARPSHAYVDLSPGLDFETRLFYKADAAKLLRAELARPGYVCKPIMLGSNTDPYQPVEREQRVTRQILEVLAECRHPVAIITKGALLERDLDIAQPDVAHTLDLGQPGIQQVAQQAVLLRQHGQRVGAGVGVVVGGVRHRMNGLPVLLQQAGDQRQACLQRCRAIHVEHRALPQQGHSQVARAFEQVFGLRSHAAPVGWRAFVELGLGLAFSGLGQLQEGVVVFEVLAAGPVRSAQRFQPGLGFCQQRILIAQCVPRSSARLPGSSPLGQQPLVGCIGMSRLPLQSCSKFEP